MTALTTTRRQEMEAAVREYGQLGRDAAYELLASDKAKDSEIERLREQSESNADHARIANANHASAMRCIKANAETLAAKDAVIADWKQLLSEANAHIRIEQAEMGRVTKFLGEVRGKYSAAIAEIAGLRALVHVPGLWECPKCHFQLVQAALRASDGAVVVRDEPGEMCPNCKTPLWRVSERKAGNDLADRCGDATKECAELRAQLSTALEDARRLREALRPFAQNAENWALSCACADNEVIGLIADSPVLTVGDLRRAHTALTEQEEKPSDG